VLDSRKLKQTLEPFFYDPWTVEEVAEYVQSQKPEWREYVLNWVKSIAKTQPELAYQYAARVAGALEQIGQQGAEQWLQNALDTYFSEGLYPANQIIKNLDSFIEQFHLTQKGTELKEIKTVLENFLHGLNGRQLNIKQSDAVYTDTETIFLPNVLCKFEHKKKNFDLYKSMAVHQWAQTWYGSWRLDVQAEMQQFASPARALPLFHQLETLRLNACLQRDFPGLHRQMKQFEQTDFEAQFPAHIIQQLKQPAADASTSLSCLQQLYPENRGIENTLYQGEMLPDQVSAVIQARILKEKDLFRLALAKMADEMGHEDYQAAGLDEPAPDDTPDSTDDPGAQFQRKQIADPDQPQGFSYELELDGNPAIPNDDTQSLIDSIIQDHGEIPEDYLVAAGSGAYHVWQAQQQEEQDPDDVWKGTYHEEGAFLYDEWDCTRQAHRKNWCALREKEVKADYDSDFFTHTLNKYRELGNTLRRTFEAMRDENKVLKRQPDGENLDIDALVNALADVRSGMEMSSRIYTRAHRAERNIAVIFMIDMSGSTRGWINTAQREALVLLCEALQSLGDRYAIYGFSGMTRKRCELYRIKTFDDSYDDEVRARICAIEAQDYTRMGVTIRHLTHLFRDVQARTKLLITLSDGKPDDYDSYHGEYGIEDTRMSLFEARLEGIHPFCITIDEEARDYLPHLYGHANYVVIDDVKKLPYKISDIYRKLTT
jgi:nitric oxide reductase NorD protein